MGLEDLQEGFTQFRLKLKQQGIDGELNSAIKGLVRRLRALETVLIRYRFGVALALHLQQKVMVPSLRGEINEKDSKVRFGRDLFWQATQGISLDIESFYVHTAILLTLATKVASLFLKKSPKQPPRSSFTKHRKFFLNPKNQPYAPDETYAQHIRNRTEWYDSFCAYRDKHVVHEGLYELTGLTKDENGIIRLYKTGLGAKEHLNALRDLKQKYEDKAPELREVEDPYRLLRRLREINLNAGDRKFLTEIEEDFGLEFIGIEDLLPKVIEYLNFVLEHFSKKTLELVEL